jgi:branched-chain amino acid transport system ATP-binding protein
MASAGGERAKALLAEFLPGDRGAMPAAALTYGEERKVGIARALALEPRYLLLDEPAAGMAAAEVEDLREAIVRIRAVYGCGILVVEHNMALIFALCDRIHVLGSGRTLAVGSPEEIGANATVREAYLGVSESASA